MENKDDYFELLSLYGTRASLLRFLNYSFSSNQVQKMKKKELALAVLQAKWSFEYLSDDKNFKE